MTLPTLSASMPAWSRVSIDRASDAGRHLTPAAGTWPMSRPGPSAATIIVAPNAAEMSRRFMSLPSRPKPGPPRWPVLTASRSGDRGAGQGVARSPASDGALSGAPAGGRMWIGRYRGCAVRSTYVRSPTGGSGHFGGAPQHRYVRPGRPMRHGRPGRPMAASGERGSLSTSSRTAPADWSNAACSAASARSRGPAPCRPRRGRPARRRTGPSVLNSPLSRTAHGSTRLRSRRIDSTISKPTPPARRTRTRS